MEGILENVGEWREWGTGAGEGAGGDLPNTSQSTFVRPGAVPSRQGYGTRWGCLSKLNPVDPYSLKPPGFQPLSLYKVKTRFQSLLFQIPNVHRYSPVQHGDSRATGRFGGEQRG
jgi:hypothetical protein